VTKLNVLLLVALVLSSLLAVNNAYESRRVFSELDRARQQQAQLDAEFKRLDAERQAQGTHLLVERAAREKLKMRTASPAVTAYVEDTAASGAQR
jgi:cell division protein FtsL